jgi:flagellar motor switch protein FliN
MNMDEKMMTPEEAVELLLTDCVRQLSELTNAPWRKSETPSELPEESEYDFRADVAFSGAITGNLQFILAAPYVLRIASAATGRECDDVGEAETEALRAFVDGLFRTFCEEQVSTYGRVVAETKVGSSVSSATKIVEVSLADPSDEQVNLRVMFSAGLLDSLAGKVPENAPGEAPEEETGVSTETVIRPALSDSPENRNLDLVLDVELSVTLRFGQRQLSLREVLELTSGSVVELDRQVEEPVELLLDGRVIARGEAVVIDGNYGLRVTEVPTEISALNLR